MPALAILAHHSEPSDPVLLGWLVGTFEEVLGLGPATVVVPIAIGIGVFPCLLGWLAWRARCRYAAGASDSPDATDIGGDGLRAK
jgi:hypothetical protein